jgi:hypothetical protein
MGSADISSPLMNSAIRGGEWSVSRSSRFNLGIHWLGGPRSRFGRRGKILPLSEFQHWPSSPQAVSIPTELSWLHVSLCIHSTFLCQVFFRNVDVLPLDYMTLHPRIQKNFPLRSFRHDETLIRGFKNNSDYT